MLRNARLPNLRGHPITPRLRACLPRAGKQLRKHSSFPANLIKAAKCQAAATLQPAPGLPLPFCHSVTLSAVWHRCTWQILPATKARTLAPPACLFIANLESAQDIALSPLVCTGCGLTRNASAALSLLRAIPIQCINQHAEHVLPRSARAL